ncbi:MAG TPA: MFS transporter [Opitutaceae bacterium]|jgi:Na+/melibiose symporter-like transporter
MSETTQRLSFVEKVGYSLGDAAANFVFMTMILFQANFYTDVFGLAAGTAGTIILVARLWDAFFDPLMGVAADRTHTRWGRFRPWVLFTAAPWAIVMFLAYRTPAGWSGTSLVAYALITNILLMTVYSMNNMPYSALGGVMTGDVNERASIFSFRFVSANIAQFIVGGFTLPLVAKFSGPEHDRQHGWAMTMGLWSILCFFLFLGTFFTCRERIHPEPKQKSTPKQDFGDLIRNSPWIFMFLLTFVQFAILSMRGGALYNYFHYYVDKGAMYDWLASLHLTGAPLAADAPHPGGVLEWLGYIVHADRANLASSNVADVGNSIFNIIGTAVMIIAIILSPPLARKLGKKAVVVGGFCLTAVVSAALYLAGPRDIGLMLVITVLWSVAYGPTSPLCWAMFADVADYSEWKNHRRATGIVFATIGFALKAGLSIGSASLLWLLSGYGYAANQVQTPRALEGIRACSSLYVGALFIVCAFFVACYKINKKMTLQIANDLAERRRSLASA